MICRFLDDRFDFVYQRLLFAGVPMAAWPALVRKLVRVTTPGGWIELVEAPPLELLWTPAGEPGFWPYAMAVLCGRPERSA